MRFLSADSIFTAINPPIKDGIVVINDDGTIAEVMTTEQFSIHDNRLEKVEHFKGWLSPGFINTHCHLELSHLKGIISENAGMSGFISQLLKNRFLFSEEVMQQSYIDAEKEMLQHGIVAVGDISNFNSTLSIKQKGNLYYHTFIELSGLDPYEAGNIIDKGNLLKEKFKKVPQGNSSLSPHAPYSVSPRLFSLLKESCYVDDEPVTIHMQESKDEIQFMFNKTGSLADLFTKLKFNFSSLPVFEERPIKIVLPQLPNCNRVLLVHNTYTEKNEITWANTIIKNIYWCLCPNANIYIENRLPDIPSMIEAKAVLTLGTDSLASNHTLSIMDEMKIIQKHYPEIKLEEMLSWATINGAKFLGIEKQYGSLEKGKQPGILNIDDDLNVKRIF